MKVKLIEPYGLCFGAYSAYKTCIETKEKYKDLNVFLFGPIVHNEYINDELRNIGINILDLPYQKYFDVIDTLNTDDVVILPAHGHDHKLEEKLNKKGIKYIDATCKIIKEIHAKIEETVQNSEVIFVGQKEHIETITTLLLNDKIYLYDIKDGFINNIKPKTNNTSIFMQSTLTEFDITDALTSIKTEYPQSIFVNNLCNACVLRQRKLMDKIDDNSYVIVVGSKTSSNTNSLVKICEKTAFSKKNPADRHYFSQISSFEEIKKLDLDPTLDYIIVSGSSVPNKLVEDIYNYVKSL